MSERAISTSAPCRCPLLHYLLSIFTCVLVFKMFKRLLKKQAVASWSILEYSEQEGANRGTVKVKNCILIDIVHLTSLDPIKSVAGEKLF